MGLGQPEYANTLRGVAMYALSQWRFWQAYRSRDEADEMIRTGNMQAYSAVLQQITGRRQLDQWIEAVEHF